MKVFKTALPGVLRIEPRRHEDARGYFLETWQAERYAEAGIEGPFLQDSLSFSRHGVLRGLHLQWPPAQGKLVYVLSGEVFDAAVDLRRSSRHFGQWTGARLRARDHAQLWIPPGFAHGFLVTGKSALFGYKCAGAAYDPASELAVRWNDPALAIDWPLASPQVSEKDAAAPLLAEIDPSRLPG